MSLGLCNGNFLTECRDFIRAFPRLCGGGRYALRYRSFLRNALRAVLHALTQRIVTATFIVSSSSSKIHFICSYNELSCSINLIMLKTVLVFIFFYKTVFNFTNKNINIYKVYIF